MLIPLAIAFMNELCLLRYRCDHETESTVLRRSVCIQGRTLQRTPDPTCKLMQSQVGKGAIMIKQHERCT